MTTPDRTQLVSMPVERYAATEAMATQVADIPRRLAENGGQVTLWVNDNAYVLMTPERYAELQG
jgi:hypothetical protein